MGKIRKLSKLKFSIQILVLLKYKIGKIIDENNA